MRRPLAFLVPLLLLAPTAQARQVKETQPLMLAAGQPVKITGMDLDFAPGILEELAESDAKAARKRVEAGLPPLDPNSYPTGPQDGATYATMPFKQMFPLVIRDVAREWKLNDGTPVKLRITLDMLKTADAAMAILVAWSSDMLEGTVDVIDATSGASLGSFRVEVKNMHGGWGGMLIRGGGVREKLAEEFGLELSRHIAGKKRPG
ncbi:MULTISPECIES: hypothetical protein [Sphingobium]|jgi:hypothetical protein|uniref:hypothetical protein n=1 Tax=Sphingobium TaxID=165695 RepID=UPI000DBB637B|nr:MULTISPECIES: hypothetical protein [Sphingobium]KAA9018610.1 hypothetical protein F4U94_06175 [Sphingobium limneticum]MBU0933680.1 hypothetical protein [Alphaproteobacteria bacterium]BBC99628.1 hypothetical protein YGS_C1P0884 [Sphingobium sp. YG1]